MIYDVQKLPTSLLVPHYLLHAAAYYVYGVTFISDSDFDALSRRLFVEWDDTHHRHKGLIERRSLKTTGAYLVNRFPRIVLNTVEQFIVDGLPEKHLRPGPLDLLVCGEKLAKTGDFMSLLD